MDENAVLPNVPGAQPVTQRPVSGQQSGGVPSTQQSVPAESPRLTLEDLYGSSKPQEQMLQQPSMATPIVPQGASTAPSGESVLSAQRPVEPVIPAPQSPPSSDLQPVAVDQLPVASVLPQGEQPPAGSLPETPSEAVQAPQTPDVPQGASRRVLEEQATQLSHAQIPGSQDASTKDTGGKKPGGLPGMLKFLIGGFVVLIVLFILWGLGSMLFSGQGQSGKVTLTYWGLWEDTNVMQPILDDFQKQHPNITVAYSMQDPKDYTKRLLTRVQDGTGPDVFRFHNTWVYPLQSLLLPLPTQVITKQDLDANYPSVVSHDVVQNGALYGVPLQMDTLSLFVNTDIFSHAGASVPTTWENFITVAKALTVKDATGKIQTAGAAIGTYGNIAHAPDIASLLLLQNGADLNKLSPSQNANDALTFYTAFAQGDSSVWDGTLDNSLQAFARGKVAMYFGYSFDIFSIKAIAPTLNFAVHPVPHLPGRDMTVASYWLEGISNRSKHQKEALLLMQYLAQKDVQAKIYTEETKTRPFGELYARTDLAEGLKGNPLLEPFVSQYKNAQSSFFVGDTGYDEYNGALNQYLGNAINSVVQNTSIDSAMQTLSQGVSQVMSTYAPKTAQ